MNRALLSIAITALALTACTSSSTPSPSPRSTVVTGTRTVVTTRTVAPPSGTAPESVPVLPASGTLPAGEVRRTCPYIKAGQDSEPTTGANIADLEGDRVGTVTVLTGYRPVGCRFYFLYSYGRTRHEAVADIRPYTFDSATEARNAMIRTAAAGTQNLVAQDFVDGLTGISFRTRYFGPDRARDWAFAFAKGTRMVVVYTQRDDTSRNALYIAQAIAAKF